MKNSTGCEIYVHIPFCQRKCDYCDFVSSVCSSDIQKKYFDALKKQIELKAETTGRVPVVSCFFGGGTPSLPDYKHIVSVLDMLRDRFSFEKEAEVTVEVNPASANIEKLKAYRDAGINRISIGLQSTVDSELKLLSRLHDYNGFLRTYDDAVSAGFTNINVDLMSAIPSQTIDSYRLSLERILKLNPAHISAYSLILEEGTPFFERYKDGMGLPDEDTDREMYYLTKAMLLDHGYNRYEISNYAKEGFECRHNLGYWRRVPYLGFGVSAASLFDETRSTVHSDINRFINLDFSEQKEILDNEDAMEEFMFLGLRCIKGVDPLEFLECFSADIHDIYGNSIKKLKKQGLLIDKERIYLTDRGLDVANYCMSEFIR